MLGNYPVASQLVASRVVLSFIELVNTGSISPQFPSPSLIIIIALQPFFGFWLLYQSPDPTHNQLDSLDGGLANLKPVTCTEDNINSEQTHRHSCLDCDSIPRPQCLRGKTGQTVAAEGAKTPTAAEIHHTTTKKQQNTHQPGKNVTPQK
jgi:hypothetical protein